MRSGKRADVPSSLDRLGKRFAAWRKTRSVGERLAQFARGNAYGENVVYSGPIFENLRIEGERAILTFQHGGGGCDQRSDR